ncbi:MAG: hypothetical protein JNN12_15725 [Bacteroidetes Order II. Incertae sedis bacterium]|nr:hypothetical protein [Bacteroidetes Order II. bacterium]HRR09910.1 hypothetical protein [Rhodothermales bacterium]
MLPVLFATLLILGVAFALMSVRVLFKKDGEFHGTCATNNPMLNKEGLACGACGRKPEECDRRKNNAISLHTN